MYLSTFPLVKEKLITTLSPRRDSLAESLLYDIPAAEPHNHTFVTATLPDCFTLTIYLEERETVKVSKLLMLHCHAYLLQKYPVRAAYT